MAEHDHRRSPAQEHDSDISRTDDVHFEPEEELGDLPAAAAKLKKLKAELANVKAERQEFLDGWQRCKADSANARRESLIEGTRSAERAVDSFILDLIPALDGFDLASGSEAWANVDDAWRSGIEHIRNSLLDVLRSRGVERYGKVGDMFDAKLHEAVQETDEGPGEQHSIVRILRFGYKRGESVLRAAQVIIRA